MAKKAKRKSKPLYPKGMTLDGFLASLKSCKLLDVPSLKQLMKNYQVEEIDQLMTLLLDKDLLTKFQIRAVSHGTTKGLTLGQYQILDKIGEGGMGAVYKARHTVMDRTVALKVLTRESKQQKLAVKRFLREAKTAARLSHNNIVAAQDSGKIEGYHFIAMEYIDGKNLSQLVRRSGKLSLSKAIEYIIQIAQGLAYSHQQGVVHRDIKPANILVDKQGTVKILDMGLARLDEDDANQTHLTQDGAVMGTVEYMPPEQAINAKNVDRRSDLYSLGCTLYYLLTGKPPFTEGNQLVKMLAHREKPAPDLFDKRKDAPRELNNIYQKLMSKDPADRFQSAEELITTLKTLLPKVEELEEEATLDLKPLSEMFEETDSNLLLDSIANDQSHSFVLNPIRKTVTRQEKIRRLAVKVGAAATGLIIVIFLLNLLLSSFSDSENNTVHIQVVDPNAEDPFEDVSDPGLILNQPPVVQNTPSPADRVIQNTDRNISDAVVESLNQNVNSLPTVPVNYQHKLLPSYLKIFKTPVSISDYIYSVDSDSFGHTYLLSKAPISPRNFISSIDQTTVSNLKTYYLTKLDIKCNVLWSKRIESLYRPNLALNRSGDCYLYGKINQYIYISDENSTVPFSLSGTQQQYIIAYSPEGIIRWNRIAKNTANRPISTFQLALNNSGDLIVTTYANSSFRLNISGSPSFNARTFHIFSISNEGTLNWFHQQEGNLTIEQISTTPDESILLVGVENSPTDYDNGPKDIYLKQFEKTKLNRFLLYLDREGRFQWVKRIRGLETYNEFKLQLASDQQNSVYLRLDINQVDGDVYLEDQFICDAGYNQVLIALDSDGVFKWKYDLDQRTGKSFLTSNEKDTIFLASNFQGKNPFLEDGSNEDKLIYNESSHLVVLALNEQGALIDQVTTSTLELNSIRGISVDSDNRVIVTGLVNNPQNTMVSQTRQNANNIFQNYFVQKFKFESNLNKSQISSSLPISKSPLYMNIDIPEKNVCFVLATTNEMVGSKILKVKNEVLKTVNEMIACKFNVIIYGKSTKAFRTNQWADSSRDLSTLNDWLDTEIDMGNLEGPFKAFSQAITLLPKPDVIFFVTSSDISDIESVALSKLVKENRIPIRVISIDQPMSDNLNRLLISGGTSHLRFSSIGRPPSSSLTSSPAIQPVDPSLPDTFLNSNFMRMQLIKPGKFMMGEKQDEPAVVSQAFYMGSYEVTQKQYERVMGKNPSDPINSNFPVNKVTYQDAIDFCKKLSELPEEKKAGRVYRLPTEVEWEYACRADSGSNYFYGEDISISGAYSWNQSNANGSVHSIGLKLANPWGLYDMYGNVGEYCDSQRDLSVKLTSTGQFNIGRKILRGGQYNLSADKCSSTYIAVAVENMSASYFGFRVALGTDSNSSFKSPDSFTPRELPPGTERRRTNVLTAVDPKRKFSSYPIDIPIPNDCLLITESMPITAGTKIAACWANRWEPLTVLEVTKDGGPLFIHWDNYSDSYDAYMNRDQLIIQKDTLNRLNRN